MGVKSSDVMKYFVLPSKSYLIREIPWRELCLRSLFEYVRVYFVFDAPYNDAVRHCWQMRYQLVLKEILNDVNDRTLPKLIKFQFSRKISDVYDLKFANIVLNVQ